MDTDALDALGVCLGIDNDDTAQNLVSSHFEQSSHLQHTSTSWDSNQLPSDPPPQTDEFSMMLMAPTERLDSPFNDDLLMPAMSAQTIHQQQPNVFESQNLNLSITQAPSAGNQPSAGQPQTTGQQQTVLPTIYRYVTPSMITPTGGTSQHMNAFASVGNETPVARAVDTYIDDPWNNPEYTPLIKWVMSASEDDLKKSFEKTVPPHLKPTSWKGFRSDDAKCAINIGQRDLGKWKEPPRLVLDARNVFSYDFTAAKPSLAGRDFMLFCQLCSAVGRSATTDSEQFKSFSRTDGNRQYLYRCRTQECGWEQQCFRPTNMMPVCMTKAKQLGMDVYEYLLGDYDHVVSRIKSTLTNLSDIEPDIYGTKTKVTKMENFEPFMGVRMPKPNPKSLKCQVSLQPPGLPIIPFPDGLTMSMMSSKRPAPAPPQSIMKKQRRKEAVQVKDLELIFWNQFQLFYKEDIDACALTKETFKQICFNRNIICDTMVKTSDVRSSMNGASFSYDSLVKIANKAIVRLFSDISLSTQEVRDHCMEALGFEEDEIVELLSKSLPAAQPASRSETDAQLVNQNNMQALYGATYTLASPNTQEKYSPIPTARMGSAMGSARNKSPLVPSGYEGGVSTISHPVSSVPNHFRPVDGFYESDLQPSQPLQQPDMNCVCSVAPTTPCKLIQCALCSKWSHTSCYSIDCTQFDDFEGAMAHWCCMHCKPTVYQELTCGVICPIPTLSSLPCMCNYTYPRPFETLGNIDYDDTNWMQCSNASCGRLLHAKCCLPFDASLVLCTLCHEADASDDD